MPRPRDRFTMEGIILELIGHARYNKIGGMEKTGLQDGGCLCRYVWVNVFVIVSIL